MQISDTEMTVLCCQSVSAQSAPARLSGSEYANYQDWSGKQDCLTAARATTGLATSFGCPPEPRSDS